MPSEPLDQASRARAAADHPYVIRGWDTRAPAPGLSRRASRRVRELAEALFSTDDGPPPRARIDWVVDDLCDFFGNANWRAALIFRGCLLAVTWLAPLLSLRLPPLGRLAVEDRVEAVERFERVPGAVLTVLGVKAILSLVYYEHPDAAREIRWDQRCREERREQEERLP
ncbi:MAG: hypothetical protein M5U28_09855 [Sandaracinaceae bacterium]|nr:hypothetical protein [Sandaracinaceae bacterium]